MSESVGIQPRAQRAVVATETPRAPLRAVESPAPVWTPRFGAMWTWRGEFGAVIDRMPADVWRAPERAGWTRVKQNSAREVWRAELAGVPCYVKYFFETHWRDRLKRWLRGPVCEMEWRGGLYALKAGIPAVTPLALAKEVARGIQRCALLITRAIEPAYTLSEFWRLLHTDHDARRRREDTEQLIESLAQTIAGAHQNGFEHLDMHAGNILIQSVASRRYRAAFVDLQSARLDQPLSDAAVVRNLSQLNQWFRRHSSVGDRIRFLRAYLRWRDEYEQVAAHGRSLELDFDGLVERLAEQASVHASRLWSRRDRRSCRDGRYFQRVSVAGGWRGSVAVRAKHPRPESLASTLPFERRWWASQLSKPLGWFGKDANLAKQSHSASVVRASLPLPDGTAMSVIVKRPQRRSLWRSLRHALPPSRSRRAFQIGHALLNRDIPTARPLAFLEQRVGPLVRDSVLITEAIPGALDLSSYLRREHADRSPRAWRRLKRELCELLARRLRGLWEAGLLHRDCKAENILVVPEAPRLIWIDMDGLTQASRRSNDDEFRPLVRLHVSLMNTPGLTRTDRVRFLRRYLARFGANPREWRRVWSALGSAAEKKLAARERRREWKLRHYGRE